MAAPSLRFMAIGRSTATREPLRQPNRRDGLSPALARDVNPCRPRPTPGRAVHRRFLHARLVSACGLQKRCLHPAPDHQMCVAVPARRVNEHPAATPHRCTRSNPCTTRPVPAVSTLAPTRSTKVSCNSLLHGMCQTWREMTAVARLMHSVAERQQD